MTGVHLLVGSGGQIGEALAGRLAGPGDAVFITSHRQPLPSIGQTTSLFWDISSPADPSRQDNEEQELPALDAALEVGTLRSVSLFAHPSFVRTDSPSEGSLESLGHLSRIVRLIDRLRPRLSPDGTLLVFFPSLSRHRAGGYLFARAWIGALEGVFGEWSRTPQGPVTTGIEILVAPDRHRPHMTQEMESRIASRTSRGRLATAPEIADFAAWLILSRSPLFHGQILRTEGGPYY
ncbi:MAG: hypothetical protein ACP5OS_08345 [Leptospirillia bacterium]